MNSETHDRLPVMDGLRGISIAAVIYQHFWSTYICYQVVPGFPNSYPYYLSFGWLAVNLFFIHSGFVLYRPYANRVREMAAGDFYKRRFWRLMPLFSFMVMVATLMRTWPAEAKIYEALLALSTLNLFTFYHWFSPLNGTWWSIGLELWFSALFPFLWWASRKTGVLRLYFYVALLAYVVRVQGAGFSYLDSYNLNPIKDSVLGRLDDFVLGFVLCKVYADGRLKVPSALLFVSGAVLFVMTVHGWTLRNDGLLSSFQVAALHNLAQAAFFLMSLAALQSRGLLKSFLTLWPLRLAGAMCFSIYLWHGALVQLAPGWNKSLLELTWMTVLTLLLSAFTFRCIEFGRVRDWRALFLLSPAPRATPVDIAGSVEAAV